MKKYDYPPEELKLKNLAEYQMLKIRAQEYASKLAEFKGLKEHHEKMSAYHMEKSKEYSKIYEELKKENE